MTAAKDTAKYKFVLSRLDDKIVMGEGGIGRRQMSNESLFTPVLIDLKGFEMNKRTLLSYFGCVGELGEFAAAVFRALSTELVLVKEAFSVEEVLVMKPFSIELPRVRDARVGGFETLEERA